MKFLIIALILIALVIACIFYIYRKSTIVIGRQEKAGLTLTVYAERLRVTAEQIEQPHSEVFWEMAEHLEHLRTEVMSDSRDLAQARRFIYHHANVIVSLVEKFADLYEKSRPEHSDRLKEMAVQIHSYRDVFARVLRACVDNDFDDMEAAMVALDTQLERLAF
ncbi:MAG: hypothetical protein ABJM43_01440 [Paracoccaceae bacterium]